MNLYSTSIKIMYCNLHLYALNGDMSKGVEF